MCVRGGKAHLHVVLVDSCDKQHRIHALEAVDPLGALVALATHVGEAELLLLVFPTDLGDASGHLSRLEDLGWRVIQSGKDA